MGWKASFIIINSSKAVDEKRLLNDLGYMHLAEAGEVTFSEAINPDNEYLYVGAYKGNLIICVEGLPMFFFDPKTPAEAEIFAHHFPNAEICAVALQSAVNFWGYAVIINGERVRAKAGTADSGTFIDMGQPLEEEQALLAKSKLDESGNRVYAFEEFPGELLTEDQVGENLVFSVCSRYIGEALDQADQLFDNTKFTKYTFVWQSLQKPKIQNTKITEEQFSSKGEHTSKKWWQFWK